jgi:hypothetical protein
VDGLNAIQRDVHFVPDQDAFPNVQLIGFQVKRETGEVQHCPHKCQDASHGDGPNEKPGVSVALEIKGHEDGPSRTHQRLGLPPDQNQQS